MNLFGLIFLQVQQTVQDTAHAANAATANETSMSLLDLILKGRWLMLPLIILLIVAIYIFIERLIVVTRSAKVTPNFMDRIQDLVQDGNIKEARNLCKAENTPVSRILDKGLRKIGKPIDDIERALESGGKLEVYRLEKNLSILGIISGIAPMFGFLGTIAGVITIFYNISQTKDISIDVISGGLYVKMITSAAGLIVGIFANLAYHTIVLMVDRQIFKMESTAIDFVDLLTEPTA